MRKVLGIGCVTLGILCLLASAALIFYNRWEARNAEAASSEILREYRQQTNVQNRTPAQTDLPEETEEAVLPDPNRKMPAVSLYGYDCIGVLSIPVLGLELPVLADWSYDKLDAAPCQFFGNCYGPDFVIAGHNYDAHFGSLPMLQAGDLVLFTDTTGEAYCYEVVLQETLSPKATDAMLTSGFDLSLYTCTPGGGSRVTVRCRKIDPSAIKTK